MLPNLQLRDELRQQHPKLHLALTNLIVALDKAVESQGKRTLLGRDKSVGAYDQLMKRFTDLITVMAAGGHIRPSMNSATILDKILVALEQFSQAYPDWQAAYGLAHQMLEVDRNRAVNIIDRIR